MRNALFVPIARCAVVFAVALALASAAFAQGYPSKVVRFVVPFTAGSSPDVTARIIASKLSENLGQPVIIENRPGAAGIIGAEFVAKSAPDGYTFLYPVNSVIVSNPHLYSKLPYDAVKSFVPVTMTVQFGYVMLARKGLEVNDLKDLMAMAKANPTKLNFGSGGPGVGNHVSMELFLGMTGLKMTHIPHRDSAQSVVVGDSDVSLVPYPTAVPLAKSGRARPLGVTLTKRHEALPSVPSISEIVPGYMADAWHGTLAPAGTPPAIVDRMATETARVLKTPEVRERLQALGLDPVGLGPAEFAQAVKSDLDKWGKVIRGLNLKLD